MRPARHSNDNPASHKAMSGVASNIMASDGLLMLQALSSNPHGLLLMGACVVHAAIYGIFQVAAAARRLDRWAAVMQEPYSSSAVV